MKIPRLRKVKILPQGCLTLKSCSLKVPCCQHPRAGRQCQAGTTVAPPTSFSKSQFTPGRGYSWGNWLGTLVKFQGQVTQESSPEPTVVTGWVSGCREHILKEKKTSFISNPRGNAQPNGSLPRPVYGNMATPTIPQGSCDSSLWHQDEFQFSLLGFSRSLSAEWCPWERPTSIWGLRGPWD